MVRCCILFSFLGVEFDIKEDKNEKMKRMVNRMVKMDSDESKRKFNDCERKRDRYI